MSSGNVRSMAPRRGLTLASAVGALLIAGPLAASPHSEAITRHADADLAALRAQRSDPAARCALGAIYARRDDLPRAALYLAGCEHADLPGDIAAPVLRAVRDVKRRLDASRHAALDVISHPEGLTAEIDALPGESFTTPATVWVAPGAHTIRVSDGARTWSRQVTTEPRKNGVVVIETGLGARPQPPRKPVAINFGDEAGGALGEQHTAPPPDIRHPSLMKDKYRGVSETSTQDAIVDPLAPREVPAGERSIWLGLRLGGGMFDDSVGSARAGFALGVAGRYRMTDAMFAAGRVDWTRRGGDAMAPDIDVLGACAGVGATVLGDASSQSVALALLAQLRADLRLADLRGSSAVPRVGLGMAVSAELAFPATPFTAGLRFEQGLTELVAGARDRAVLAEVGIDLR